MKYIIADPIASCPSEPISRHCPKCQELPAMYGSSNRYTFISSAAVPSQAREHHNSIQHHSRPSKPKRRDSDRCDVHHSVAQLYLRTLPSLDALPRQYRSRSRRSNSDTPRSKQTQKMVSISNVGTAALPALGKSPPPFNPSASFAQFQEQTFPALSCTDDSTSSVSSGSSSSSDRLSPTQLRAVLASSMSNMYRQEVPLYGDLLSIIGSVNGDCIRAHPDLISDDEISRLNVERHGAIRVGTQEELQVLSRIFGVFGMHAVGYYDLWKDAGLPIHATAFRPVGAEELVKNPFRIFTSLLRMDLVKDPATSQLAEELLSRRKIVSDRCLELLDRADDLTRVEALEFVDEVVQIFAWHASTPVTMEQYQLLSKTHPLVADIVSFRGPHINHLTPRTLDIDDVQREMVRQGMDAKEVVEGPPMRLNPIFLRQTSFHALSEEVRFAGGMGGRHKARFGEIEARGQALTRRGARLYDELMEKVGDVKRERESEKGRVGKDECVEILTEVFREGFPDEKGQIMREGLGYWTFSVRDAALAKKVWEEKGEKKGYGLLAEMVETGALKAELITYEDFLPASAAGIFQSNLPRQSHRATKDDEAGKTEEMDEKQARARLEAAVGGKILDYFELYAKQQAQSLREVGATIGVEMEELSKEVENEGA